MTLTKELRSTMKRSVKRGVELMNKVNPNWKHNINVGELDMASGDSCILGQLYDGYGMGQREVFDGDPGAYGDMRRENLSIEHGFNLPDGIDEEEQSAAYHYLDERWAKAIEEE